MGTFFPVFRLFVIMDPLTTQAVVVAPLPFWAVLGALSTLFSSFKMRGTNGESAVAEGRGGAARQGSESEEFRGADRSSEPA